MVDTLLPDQPPTTTGPASGEGLSHVPGAAGDGQENRPRAVLSLALVSNRLLGQGGIGPRDLRTGTASGSHISGHSAVATWEERSRHGQGGLQWSKPEGRGHYD